MLRQRALDDRRLVGQLKGDRARIIVGNRASFLAALANVAALKCRANLAEADELLRPAFEAARTAEASNSEYARARKWGEAAFIATDVTARLIDQLPR